MDLPTKSIKDKENTMSYRDIIRAWKGKEYQRSLSEEQHVVLPESPAGLIELEDVDLDNAAGGTGCGDSQKTIAAYPGSNCYLEK
jgi:mersacidin/lichenicidin family type 2 lantibiotic